MAYLDLRTGEIYRHILHLDAWCAIFASDHGESMISRAEFDQLAAVADLTPRQVRRKGQVVRLAPAEEDAPLIAAERFQFIGALDEPPAVATRRDQLAAYAAGNGGRVDVHQAQEPPAEPKSLGGRLAALFAPS